MQIATKAKCNEMYYLILDCADMSCLETARQQDRTGQAPADMCRISNRYPLLINVNTFIEQKSVAIVVKGVKNAWHFDGGTYLPRFYAFFVVVIVWSCIMMLSLD